MATVVAIMDEPRWDGNTDVIVVADPATRSLLWVPRDLWSPSLGDRINRAYALGGHPGLLRALAGLGVTAEHSVCVRRDASEAALAEVTVTVPVRGPQTLLYPVSPRARLEDGQITVTFRPPAETLSGDRIHQWVGARKPHTDFERIERQQVFVRSLLEQGYDFTAIARDGGVSASDGEALAELRSVDRSWWFRTFRPARPTVVGSAQVLIAGRPGRAVRARLAARRLRTRLRRGR